MGHDFSLIYDENKCDTCGRCDSGTIEDNMYVSYNHCWAWYDHVDKERGFVSIYNKPVTEVIPMMENLKMRLQFNNDGIPTHKMNVDGSIAWSDEQIETINYEKAKDDGWAKTVFNAYRCVDEILQACYKAVRMGKLNAYFYGD